MESPNIGRDGLNGIFASSATDIWAVGSTNGFGGVDSLIEHWNGSAWSIIQSPHINGADYLTSVSAISPDDAWAVGAHWTGGITGGGHYATLIEHWDGSAWHVARSPRPGIVPVSSTVASDPWATISVLPPAATPWISPYSVERGDSNLFSVNARSARDVWAVGDFFLSGNYHLLAERWDGRNWQLEDGGLGSFSSVQVVSSRLVWGFANSSGGTRKVLIERWNGNNWEEVQSPAVGPAIVAGSAEVSPTSIWAVGQIQGSQNVPLVEHWDGKRWSIVAASAIHAVLNAVAADRAGWMVAVGEETGTAPLQPVILQGC